MPCRKANTASGPLPFRQRHGAIQSMEGAMDSGLLNFYGEIMLISIML
jgi:hypothetical protein